MLSSERTVQIDLRQREIREFDRLMNERLLAGIGDCREDGRTIVSDRKFPEMDVGNPRITLSCYLKLRRRQPTSDGVDQPKDTCPLRQVLDPRRVDQSPVKRMPPAFQIASETQQLLSKQSRRSSNAG